ncbi:MAG: hypothetical protein RL311_560 [Bacteroidota bacterium]|jgi:hypothetical protein
MKVYELHWERSHLVDENEDCSVVVFDGLEEFRFQLGGIQKYSASSKVILQGNFNIIPDKTDFPLVDIAIPLMSNKMLSILEIDATLSYNKVDAVIVDDTYLESLFDEKGQLIESIPKNTDYKFFQVLNYTDAFDKTHSSFKPLRSNPEKIGIINKLVLREPKNGFPAIFRIEEKPSILFINEATKNKFEHNRIKGCSFKEIDTALETA